MRRCVWRRRPGRGGSGRPMTAMARRRMGGRTTRAALAAAGRCSPVSADIMSLPQDARSAALELLKTMARQTSECGMIPEQVWDAEDIPERFLFNGHPSGSGHAAGVGACRVHQAASLAARRRCVGLHPGGPAALYSRAPHGELPDLDARSAARLALARQGPAARSAGACASSLDCGQEDGHSRDTRHGPGSALCNAADARRCRPARRFGFRSSCRASRKTRCRFPRRSSCA